MTKPYESHPVVNGLYVSERAHERDAIVTSIPTDHYDARFVKVGRSTPQRVHRDTSRALDSFIDKQRIKLANVPEQVMLDAQALLNTVNSALHDAERKLEAAANVIEAELHPIIAEHDAKMAALLAPYRYTFDSYGRTPDEIDAVRNHHSVGFLRGQLCMKHRKPFACVDVSQRERYLLDAGWLVRTSGEPHGIGGDVYVLSEEGLLQWDVGSGKVEDPDAKKIADRIDGLDRDDLGESPDC